MVKQRNRISQWFTPRPAPVIQGHGPIMYAVGAAGIREISVRSAATLSDIFHGIGDTDNKQFAHSPEGYARAFKASVWAYKCIRMRARTLSSVPIEIVGSDDQVIAHPLTAALSEHNTALLKYTEHDLCIFGNAYWTFGKNQQGAGWLQRLNPQTIEMVQGDGPGETLAGYLQRINGQVYAQWPAHQVAHFHEYDPDSDVTGVAPLAVALGAVGVTLAISEFAEYFFTNGAMPDGILVSTTRMTDTDKQRILAEWRRNFQGTENAHSTALLDGGQYTYQPITPPIKDLAMVELREEERRDICAALDVPMSIAQAADPALYAAQQDYVNFMSLVVLPQLDMYLDMINRHVMPWYGIPGARVRANKDEIEALQEDRGEITARNAQGVGAGYLSLNTALQREGEEPLGVDYLIISGRLVPRDLLDKGDFDALRELGILGMPEPAAAPAFPFMHAPAVDAPVRSVMPEPRIIEQLPARVDIVVRADDPQAAQRARGAVLQDTLLRDLARWQGKVIKRGPAVSFRPDYLPPALTDWLRADLLAWDGETERVEWTKSAFARAEQMVRAEPGDDDLATPEEFEAYWRGIGDLFDDITRAWEAWWAEFPAHLAAAMRDSSQTGAAFDMAAFLSAQETALIDTLAGEDGPLVHVYLAGAARGNELLSATRSVKDGLTINWQIIDEQARDWARNYAAQQVRGVNGTTMQIFRQKIAEWIEGGGSLDDLARYIEGDLEGLDIPPGWSPGKVAWATSPERARLIAQTETTEIFHEGAVSRWEQAAVEQKRFRTQNDVHVDDEICRKLNNVVTGIRAKWQHPNGNEYGIPAHPGCRCFASPVVD